MEEAAPLQHRLAAKDQLVPTSFPTTIENAASPKTTQSACQRESFAFIQAAHAAHIARIHEHISQLGIHRDTTVVGSALLARKDDPKFLAAVRRIRPQVMNAADFRR